MLIDERNYQRVLANRQEALAGTFPPPAKFLFTGLDKIQHSFAQVTDNLIIHQYVQKAIGKRAYYGIYPLKMGELLELLQEAGFSKIERFSDYQEGDNPEADFYQYVCVK